MLNMKLTFSDIDYEKTLRALFPRLLAALDRSDSNSFPIRLLQRVGQKSERAALDVLSRLPDDQKNDIVITAFRLERSRIIRSLQDVLHQNEYGRHISFEDAFMTTAPNGRIECWLENVSIDYHALACRISSDTSSAECLPIPSGDSGRSLRKSALRAAGYAARATGALMNWGIGDAAISLFMKKESIAVNKTLEHMLMQNGIFAAVCGCELLKGENSIPQEVILLNRDASLPRELAESLLDVLSAYFIELIDRAEQ